LHMAPQQVSFETTTLYLDNEMFGKAFTSAVDEASILMTASMISPDCPPDEHS
jgi:hypothetical protein